jgi:Tfp pilus assembly protein PilX
MKKRGLQRQGGFVLLSLVVFLFVAALLALGDMRTLAVQQTLVASLYAAENAMAETESALSTMEQFAAFEGSELGVTGGNARLTTLTNAEPSCPSSAVSEPSTLLCTKAKCNSFLYPKGSFTGDDNVAGGDTQGTFRQLRTGGDATECSFCPPPTLNCKARWDELPGANNSPWAQFHVNFYRNTTAPGGRAPSNPSSTVYSTQYFYGMVEYLGWAQCNLTDMDPTGTNLDAYDDYLSTAANQTRGCRVMRVTVRNQPSTPRAPTITLQSTLLVASVLNYPALPPYSKETPYCCYLADPDKPASTISKNQARYNWGGFAGAIDAERISWRQIFPN